MRHFAVADLPVSFFPHLPDSVTRDRHTITVLRSVLMKPEHLDWVDRIWAILDQLFEQQQISSSGSVKAAV